MFTNVLFQNHLTCRFFQEFDVDLNNYLFLNFSSRQEAWQNCATFTSHFLKNEVVNCYLNHATLITKIVLLQNIFINKSVVMRNEDVLDVMYNQKLKSERTRKETFFTK